MKFDFWFSKVLRGCAHFTLLLIFRVRGLNAELPPDEGADLARQRGKLLRPLTRHIASPLAALAAHRAFRNDLHELGYCVTLSAFSLIGKSEFIESLIGRFAYRIFPKSECLPFWRSHLRTYPESVEGLRMYTRLLRAVFGIEAANGEALRFLNSREDSSLQQTLIRQAVVCEEIGDSESAIVHYNKLLEYEPHSEDGLYGLARINENAGHLHAARTFYERLSERSPAQARVPLARLKGLDNSRLDFSDDHLSSAEHVLKYLISHSHELSLPILPHKQKGAWVFLNNSLGPGGAERQLVKLVEGIAEFDQCLLWVHHALVGGSESFFANRLKSERIQIEVYSEFQRVSCNEHFSESVCALLGLLPPQMVETNLRLYGRLLYERPSIIVLWQDSSLLWGGLAAALSGLPMHIGLRSSPPSDKGVDRPLLRVMLKELSRLPLTRLSCNCSFGAERYAEWLKIDPNQINIIPNGIVPLDTPEAPLLDTDLEFSKGALLVGGVMRLDSNKRPHLWLDAAVYVLDRHPTAKFVLIGDGPLGQEIVERIAGMVHSERIKYVGLSDQIPCWLEQMDILLMTSVVEGLPNAVLEAQAMGVPVIASSAGGIAEAIIPGKTGIIIEGDSNLAELMGVQILLLLNNPSSRAEMAQLAENYAQKKFVTARMISRFRESMV